MITRIWDERIAAFRYVEAVSFTGPRAEYRLSGTKTHAALTRIDEVRHAPKAEWQTPTPTPRVKRPTYPCECGTGTIPEREWVRRTRRCKTCRKRWPTTGRRKPRGGPVQPALPLEIRP